ncbi:hypothetical protein BDY19DRAFT_908928 [Irpex rosettiformis]|uniref:Uncharacterized protein n=1 Tax=Irpex rosettiformis TaxID=378272 RepID=A0ACB8TUR6_9APHY|nr:hypothetical protein BDY19DRAFT_908928 [Irpex rosettiformis]
MGPRDSRDGRRVWFELQNRAKSVGTDTRCYGLSNMLERPVNASGPPAALKIINGQLDAVQLAVKETVRANADFNMTMWSRMAPASLQRIIEAYAELTNMPRIGTYDNYMWSSCQLNLSEPQRASDEQPLGITNGRFGESHVDSRDSPTHLSCATVLSDIPSEEGWEPGRMHFLGVGCYTTLEPFKQFFFTGLQLHGSTRPTVPDSFKIPKWACRAMLISYPSQAFALGKVRHCFGVMPGKKTKTFYLPPDVYGGIHETPSDGYCTSHTSTAQDGTAVMDDASLVNFHARGLLSWAHWVMEFLPSRLQVEIDAERFLGAFTYRDGTKGRVPLKSWSMAPSSSVNEPYGDKHVDSQIEMLHTLYDRMAKGIPDLPPNTFKPEYLTERSCKSRPEAYKPPAKRLKTLPAYDEYNSVPLPPRPKRKSKRQSLKRKRERGGSNLESDDDIGSPVGSSHAVKQRKGQVLDNELDGGYNLRSSSRADKNSPHNSNEHFSPSGSKLHSVCGHSTPPYVDKELPPDSVRSSRPLDGDFDSSTSSSGSDGDDGNSEYFDEYSDDAQAGENTFTSSNGPLATTIRDHLSGEHASGVQVHDAVSPIPKENTRRLARIQRFCRSISEDNIKVELSKLLGAVDNIHAMRLETLGWSTSSLDQYQLVAQPYRMDPEDLSKYMAAFSMAKRQGESEVWTHLLRQRIILHEQRLARAVLDIEETLCTEIFNRGTFLRTPANWIERLLRDIHVRLVLKSTMNVSSHQYMSGIGTPHVSYSEPDWAVQERSWTSNRPSDAEFLRRTATYMGRILRCWFELPGSYLTRGRAQLVDTLVSKFGVGVLYLQQVWDIHRQLPRFIFRNPPHDYHSNLHNKDRPFDPSSMEDFVHAIDGMPATAVAQSNQLACFYASYLRLAQSFIHQVNAEHSVTPRSRSVDVFTPAQQALLDKPDSRICAREFSPSRQLMSCNVDKAFMRTRAGFFTSLVFRNISFNSEAFLNCPDALAKFMFNNLDEWNTYIADLHDYFSEEPEDYFCNRLALGQPLLGSILHL